MANGAERRSKVIGCKDEKERANDFDKGIHLEGFN